MSPSGRHILVVDDDDILRGAIIDGLREDGHVVRGACNGLEALAVLEAFPASIVITDIAMPEMDGLELISHLATTAPDTYHIIAMTAGLQSGPPERAAKQFVLLKAADSFGAEHTLKKPFRMPDLLDLVAQIPA